MFVRNKTYLYPKHTILDLKWLLTLPYPKKKEKRTKQTSTKKKVGGGVLCSPAHLKYDTFCVT